MATCAIAGSKPVAVTTPRRTLLMVDGTSGSPVHSVPPVLAGCQFATVSTMEEALPYLERTHPLALLVDERIFDTPLGQDPLGQARRYVSRTGVPLVLVADASTPAELLEAAWHAQAADCLLRPLLNRQVQERVELLSGGTAPLERRAAHLLLLVSEDSSLREPLAHMLSLAGYRLLLAANEAEATRRVAACNEQVEAVVLHTPEAMLGALSLARLRSAPCLSNAQGVILAPSGSMLPSCLGERAEVLVLEHACLRSLCKRLMRALPLPLCGELCALGAAPFFCPVQFRELGREQHWQSAYSHDISPNALFLRTLVPARVGAALELRVFLTTTGEVLEGSGVVAWSNPWHCSRGLWAPPGMGIHFLGMSPRRLARLREICSAATPEPLEVKP
jgi:CheY-like chemotaxis protein